ncbi:MAG: PBP1A family penicillin-binding protein [Candidatus Eremiobacteraeota bacterium]|nr:PBP1A family penicillin-binding protein [Candidatus Eremiobacteraeota bacterium]MBV8460201.1 PBP1A family penicillin-binding protein [Candidatus Eremiobacteraeota bacterium]
MNERRRRRWRLLLSALLICVALVVLGCAGVGIAMLGTYGRGLPDVSSLSTIQPTSPTVIVARDGTLLARLYDKYKVYVPITQIPQVMRDAMVATEDERFYSHRGVDLRGIMRAALANYQHEEITQGASTITQQLARKLFLNDRQTLTRKIQEALLAIEIERSYSKDEILERYLNLVYFGAGAYGVQAASHAYFGKDVSKLTLSEAAMLAGLVAAPSLYSPYNDMERARDRQRHVLDRMVATRMITRDQADAAAAEDLRLIGASDNGISSYREPYFTTYVIAQLVKQFGYDRIYRGGLTVYTTLDPRLEGAAQRAVTNGVKEGRAEGYGMHQGALVAEDPRSGEILAMVGGVGFSAASQFNRAWQARRQPGSSFKGYVYSAAVDKGVPVSSVYLDAPVTYPAGDGTDYKPLDDDHRYLGAITLRRAFELSRNIVAVRLASDIGIDTVIDYAHRMGITENLEPDLSLALGTAVVSPLDMVSGYSTIANGGVYTPPQAIRYITDEYGQTIVDNRYPDRRAALSPGAAYIMTTMMEGVIQEGTGYPNAIIGRTAAGKTGTTSDFRDAWFVGFVPQLAAAVWVGNDDYSRMYESYGGNVPARTWAAFMKAALKGVPVQQFGPVPPDVQRVKICSNGRRAVPGEGGREEFFLNGTAPLAYCVALSTPRPAPVNGVEASPFGPLTSPAPATPAPAPSPAVSDMPGATNTP